MTIEDRSIDQYAPLTGTADAFGNEVRYEYNQSIDGECKLMRITWGQNPGAGLADFAQINLKYKVGSVCNGVYTNSQTDYRSGNRIVTGASRLLEIKATAYPPGAASSPVHTWTITLRYDDQAETCQQSHAPLRLLTSIQESAWGTDSPQVNLPPVTFDYNPATVTMWWPPQGGPKPVPWYGESNLGWGLRGGSWPTVEMMFLDTAAHLPRITSHRCGYRHEKPAAWTKQQRLSVGTLWSRSILARNVPGVRLGLAGPAKIRILSVSLKLARKLVT